MAGFQNNPLTKFPLNTHPPGASTQQTPGRQPAAIQHTPIGPVSSTSKNVAVQITPLGAKSVRTNLATPYNKR